MIARRKRNGEWRTGTDYRTICSCQLHARGLHSPWYRATRIAVRSVAVLATVPIALALFDIPMKEMNLDAAVMKIDAMREARVPRLIPAMLRNESPAKPADTASSLPIFTTESIREQFLPTTQLITIDSVKEEYFRTQVPYGSIIYREAVKNDLPPELVAAMVHTESDFRPLLVSHKSAQGLMQIVPDTARLLGIANPFDPEQNIAAGTKYFRYLLNRFQDERIALAAYNAGEGKVERCGGCVPQIDETLSYIEKVNSRAHRYRQRVRNTYMASVRLGRNDWH